MHSHTYNWFELVCLVATDQKWHAHPSRVIIQPQVREHLAPIVFVGSTKVIEDDSRLVRTVAKTVVECDKVASAT